MGCSNSVPRIIELISQLGLKGVVQARNLRTQNSDHIAKYNLHIIAFSLNRSNNVWIKLVWRSNSFYNVWFANTRKPCLCSSLKLVVYVCYKIGYSALSHGICPWICDWNYRLNLCGDCRLKQWHVKCRKIKREWKCGRSL